MVENIADVSCTALVPINRLILIKKYILLEDEVFCTAIRSVAHKVVRYCTGDGLGSSVKRMVKIFLVVFFWCTRTILLAI